MLRDKLGRQFKKGQIICFMQEGLCDAEVLEVNEASVMSANGQPVTEEIVVKFSMRVPLPHPGLEIRIANVLVAKEPELESGSGKLN